MKCDGCTLCCKLLDIDWMDSPAGEYCKECEPGVGCKIYKNAPDKCLKFRCAYNQMEKASIDMRPDKCGVIFERLDDIIIGTVDPEVERLNENVLGQLEYFKDEGFSLVLYKKGNSTYYYSDEYLVEEIREKIATELERLNGSA